MAKCRFWTSLVLLVAGTLIALLLLDMVTPAMEATSVFILSTVPVFTGIVAFAFILGERTARSQNKNTFVHFVMMLILLKMFLCVMMVVYHVKVNEPETKMFVIPFLLIYLIFTIFEVFVLEKLSRTKPPAIP